MLTGGCYCRAIRYEANGKPFHETNCHCDICRRASGAPFVTWFSVKATSFRIVKGEPTRFASTAKCPDSEVRIIVRHSRLRTSESKDTSKLLI